MNLTKTKCGFTNTHELSCNYQVKKIKKGFILVERCGFYTWVKRHQLGKNEQPMLESIDWIHIHNSDSCSKVFKKEYPNEYKKTCEYFGVIP